MHTIDVLFSGSFSKTFYSTLYWCPEKHTNFTEGLKLAWYFSANTAMIYHDGRVMALNEADKPCKAFGLYNLLIRLSISHKSSFHNIVIILEIRKI
jgi:hypothetical protein